jgi:hypothetical protein
MVKYSLCRPLKRAWKNKTGVGPAILRFSSSRGLSEAIPRDRVNESDPEGVAPLSPAKAGLEFGLDVIPGLRSLHSLARGYTLPPLRGSLTPSLRLEFFEDLARSSTEHLAGDLNQIARAIPLATSIFQDRDANGKLL